MMGGGSTFVTGFDVIKYVSLESQMAWHNSNEALRYLRQKMGNDSASSAQSKRGGTEVDRLLTRDGGCKMGSDMLAAVEDT